MAAWSDERREAARAMWTPERRAEQRERALAQRAARHRAAVVRVRGGQADPGPFPTVRVEPGASAAIQGPATYRVVWLDWTGTPFRQNRETLESYVAECWRRLERRGGAMVERVWRRVPCDPTKWDACYLEEKPKPYRVPSGKWNAGQDPEPA